MAANAVRYGPDGWPEQTLFDWVEPWCEKWLKQPDGPEAGKPWQFTPEQRHFMAWWYAYDAEGRWVFRRGTLRRMKGWGKDPLGAVICAIEAFGPCRLFRTADGWKVRPHPAAWVQVVAVAREQTRTTMRLFPGLIPPATRDRYHIEINKEIIYVNAGRSVIESITSSPLSAEGPRSTFVLRNETQGWIAANDGHDMASVIDGNLAKSRDGSARALSLCNAHVPGLDSVGEREWDAYQATLSGKSKATGILYDSLEAPPDTNMADEPSLRRGLELTRGDATWLDIDRLIGEIYDPQTAPSEARRKYLNQVVAAEDALIAPYDWDALTDDRLKLVFADPDKKIDGDQVALGFDGGQTDDNTALQAVRISDGAWFDLGIWDPAQHGGEAPRDLIDGAVEHAFGGLDVVAFFADLEGWESYVDRWADKHRAVLCATASTRHPIAWDMRGRQKELTLEGVARVVNEISEAAKRVKEGAPQAGDLRHDGSVALRAHVHNARRRPNAWGISFGKEHRESKRKVDGFAAGILARMARRAYLALPPSKQRHKRSGRANFY